MSASVVPQPVAGEYGYVKIRYKLPKSDTSRLISTPIDRSVEVASFSQAPQDARFATGVAAFAELLRGGRYNGTMTYDDVLRIATRARRGRLRLSFGVHPAGPCGQDRGLARSTGALNGWRRQLGRVPPSSPPMVASTRSQLPL